MKSYSTANIEIQKQNDINTTKKFRNYTLHYIRLTPYYIIKNIFRIRSHHSTINIVTKNGEELCDNFELNKLRKHIILYGTYKLSYCKRHIQRKSYHKHANM